MGKYYNMAVNTGGGWGGLWGGKGKLVLNLLIEQTNFVFYNVKTQLHIPKIARGMDTVTTH